MGLGGATAKGRSLVTDPCGLSNSAGIQPLEQIMQGCATRCLAFGELWAVVPSKLGDGVQAPGS
jgi:hypothetical protein